MKQQTVRLVVPEWQGGMDPNYQFGAQLLAQIIPPAGLENTETIEVPVSSTAETDSHIDAEQTLLRQIRLITDILRMKDPQKVLTVGGDCAVSEAPFDYLHGKYPDDLGIIWLDAHPDVSSDQNSDHVHEMVLANLLGYGASKFNVVTSYPFKPENVLLAGLKVEDLRPKDQLVNDLGLRYVTPQQLMSDSHLVEDWLKERGLKHLAIHFDLDVLTPTDYRSILPADPTSRIEDFGAAVGDLRLDQVLRFLMDMDQAADVVGLTLAEHMPWDAIRLRNGLKKLQIFA